jgi:tetratricopeptide (TPR) repeat protein
MTEAPLPLAARIHAALARGLDPFWPRGAAWAWADAIAHAPRDPELHFLRGQSLGRARRWANAARSFAAAARLRPSSVEYQGALVIALDRAGREAELVLALRRLAELRSGEGEPHVLLGAVLRRAGRHAEALRAFRFAVRLGTLPATRRFVLGEALLGAEGWREALAAWHEARQIEASSGSVILRNAGRRSALNFHPGQPLERVPRRAVPPPPASVIGRLLGRAALLKAAITSLWRGGLRPSRRRDRVQVLRKAWRRAHPGRTPGRPAPAALGGRPTRRRPGAAA